MPQSFTQLHYHLVFSTHQRGPSITQEIQTRLWEYLGGMIRGEGGIAIRVGGVPDHIHMLVTIHQRIAIADLVRNIKAGSSGWVHDTFPNAMDFRWQSGYGAFTVSHSAVDSVRDYIARREHHHTAMTFQEELRLLLRKHDLAFDERFLWA